MTLSFSLILYFLVNIYSTEAFSSKFIPSRHNIHQQDRHRIYQSGNYNQCPPSSSSTVNTSPPSISTAPEINASAKNLLDDLLSYFQGDFDNYHQVLHDRQNSRLPGDGGGHEHFHCTLLPLSSSSSSIPSLPVDSRLLLAVYYLNADPSIIFRMRVYAFAAEDKDDERDTVVRTRLFHLTPDAEGAIRKSSHCVASWEEVLGPYLPSCLVSLPRCDILWRRGAYDPVRHDYLINGENASPAPPAEAFHALLEHSSAVVNSLVTVGKKIIVKDELSLWENELWINDRGFDYETGEWA
eukprot:CAMPEP_0172513954 /NCGR_PEP_ID=MMETSP1066-20121228/256626_1 /TAXON_ID=671091 /ORGANISM="Coscinodiscus wailesii, Strain CCMP2513" /LENGTH=296 /DNA_ID=CAMNT_0013294429 /DNA_START=54 /DNA_END=941 /DNA_ORIENTATION=+